MPETRGRRHRGRSHGSSTEKGGSKGLKDAKAKFTESVKKGIEVLMEEHGYSRGNAAAVLIREIARGEIGSPDDNEIFAVMSSHGLGIEGAVRALAVSKALQRDVSKRNVSIVEAIDDLTAKLSVSNLTRLNNHRSPSPVAEEACDDVIPRSTEVRIQPVVPTSKLTRQKTDNTNINKTAAPAASTTTGSSQRKTRSSNKPPKQKNASVTRKRTVEDLNPVDDGITSSSNNNNNNTGKKGEAPPQTRQRSDSLAEAVDAKFSESASKQQQEEASTPVARAKRGRGDECEVAAQIGSKRSRTASTS